MDKLFSSPDPSVVFDQLLSCIKTSNLNFVSRETPFQCEMTIKKTFINKPKLNFRPPTSFFPFFPVPPPKLDVFEPKELMESFGIKSELYSIKTERDELLVTLQILEKEMLALKSEKSKSANENGSQRKIIQMLEEKLANAEKVLYEQSSKSHKIEKDKMEEIKVYKAVIKNNNDEITKIKMETKDFNKILKSKEKEIHNIGNKASNQEETIANLKESKNKLKSDIKKLNRSFKHKQNEVKTIAFNQALTPPVYLCYDCGKTLKTIDAMKDHVEQEHAIIIPKCEEVHFNSYSKLGFNKKLAEYNTESNLNLACTICGNKFAVFKHMMAHMQHHHNIPVKVLNSAQTQPVFNELKCPFCENTFACAALLGEHTTNEHLISVENVDEEIFDKEYKSGRFSKNLEQTFNLTIGNTSSKMIVRYERKCKEAKFSVCVKIKNKVINSKCLVHLKKKWQYANI